MFWSANYMSMRELSFLLKEENVSLTHILEADDILQECKADNKDLIRFFSKPGVLAELVSLITEEPSPHVELRSQYRHSSIACEVLTSDLSTLSHRLCMDVEQMNRLCDFVNKEPPLNPLLASYFSRTVETLLKRSPKQDCYLHHIVCLRALDFFKARRDFLPNLLRHISTSAIADTLKYFIFCLSEPFNKIIMEWFDEHQFLENLIQIVCCNYEPEEIQATPVTLPIESQNEVEKGLKEESEKPETNHKENESGDTYPPKKDRSQTIKTLRILSSINAVELCCQISRGADDPWPTNSWCSLQLANRLRSQPLLTALLQGCFTSCDELRSQAIVNVCKLLRALLKAECVGEEVTEEETSERRRSVERAAAPHLPLLHNALLRHTDDPHHKRRRVGAARIEIAALVAELVLSDVEDVHTAILSLGTVNVLLDMFFSYPENSLLQAQVCALLRNIAKNDRHSQPYWDQLAAEGGLLERIMDLYEKNEEIRDPSLGGVLAYSVQIARVLHERVRAREPLADRWARFHEHLQPLYSRMDAPLGGEFPTETVYETGNVVSVCADATYEFNSGKENTTTTVYDDDRFGDDMWEDSPSDVLDMEEAGSFMAWEPTWGAQDPTEPEEAPTDSQEGWAQFDDANLQPVDPFAPYDTWQQNDFTEENDIAQLQLQIENMDANFGVNAKVKLMNNLVSAMSSMTPRALAAFVSDAIGQPLPDVELPIDSEKTVRENTPNISGSDTDNTQSSVDNTQSGVDNTQSGVYNTQSGVDNTQSGVDNTQSGVDNTQSGVDNTQSGVDNTQSGVDNTQSGVDNTQSGVDNKQSSVDNTKSDVDNTQSGADNTQSGVNNTQSGVDNTQSGVDKTQTDTDTKQSDTTNTQCGTDDTQSDAKITQSDTRNTQVGSENTQSSQSDRINTQLSTHNTQSNTMNPQTTINTQSDISSNSSVTGPSNQSKDTVTEITSNTSYVAQDTTINDTKDTSSTANDSSDNNGSTRNDNTSTTNDYTSTTNDNTSTTNDHTSTTNDYTSTTNDHTITTTDCTSTTNDYTSTTNDHTSTTNDYTSTTNDYTGTTNDTSSDFTQEC